MATPATKLTLQSIVDSIIRTARNGGVPSDDDRWTPYHIMWLVNNYRAEFIYQRAFMNNPVTPEIDPQTVQDMGCVPLITVDQSECPNLPWGCYVKKFSPVPKFIDFPNLAGTFVGAINKRDSFTYINQKDIQNRLSLRFSGATTFWYMIGQSLYVITRNTELCNINISSVFEDPTNVPVFSQKGIPCGFDWINDLYPISREMAMDVQHAIETNEIGMFLQTASDEVNDSASIPITGYPQKG